MLHSCPTEPTNFSELLACVLPAIYRSRDVHLAGVKCGPEPRAKFVCTTEYIDRRTGSVRHYRLHVLESGLVVKATRG